MIKLELIVQVHQFKKQDFKVAAIARKCNLSRTTVYNYLDKDFEESLKWVDELRTRRKKLDPYKEIILDWLREHPNLSSSQISDWLEEHHSYNDVSDSTVRSYVRELREFYHIPKTLNFRSYEALEELPKGKQMQVDFWEKKVKTFKGN